MYKNLTFKEREQARVALVEWFKSQDISPADGGLIMISTIADNLTEKTLDLNELAAPVKIFIELLMGDIEDFVKLKGQYK